MTVIFTIPGVPVGKGRPKFARRGQFVTTYTPEKVVTVLLREVCHHYKDRSELDRVVEQIVGFA